MWPEASRFTRILWKAWLVAGVFLLFCCTTAQAQNTKGDQPSPGRESRVKTTFKKKKSPVRNTRARRVSANPRSVASRAGGSPRRASGKERPGKPIRPISTPQPEIRQKPWSGDIAGYRLRHRNRSSAGDGKSNIYPQYNRYTNNPSRTPRKEERPASNARTLARLRGLQSQGGPTPSRARRVEPRSVSRSYIARKSINVYANFARPKRTTKMYLNRDLAGKPLRTKNFESERPGTSAHRKPPYYTGSPGGERPYSGPRLGGYKSATGTRQRPWGGDLAGRSLRFRNFTSKRSVEGRPTYAAPPRSRTAGHPGSVPIMGRPPGIGGIGVDYYRGDDRARKPRKGGGSISGKGWNNNGIPIEVRLPRQGIEAALFSGRIRSRKPQKGGGSVSGRLWNNDGLPIEGRHPRQGADAALFSGWERGSKPLKGGGSVSGRLWNNDQTPIEGRTPAGDASRAARFQGSVKVRRPERGMPDVEGSMPRRGLSSDAKKVSGYPGKVKMFELQPGFGYQGEAHKGDVRLPRKRKNYVQNPKADEESIKKLRLKGAATDVDGIVQRTRIKQPDYVRNKNATENALLKVSPSKSDLRANELTARVKQPEYARKPHAAEGALMGIKPGRGSVKAAEYARSVKRDWDYIHNPSSADLALKTREPGKAFARVAAYQGNIRMQKYALFEKNRNMHPDTRFIKTNKNNVDSERDALTNFKLWWSRLFRKEETQPDNVKYKGKKPRYDKGEIGLWYE